MPRITISYRRDDSLDITGRIFDRLAAHLGRESVFRDIDNIPAGADFRKHIDTVLDESDIILAIVGPRWIGPRAGQSRLANAADPVRLEIETVLRKNKPLIPVLVSRAPMPRPEQLPDSLQDFAYRNAVHLDAGQDFDMHTARLIRAMDRILGGLAEVLPQNPPFSRPANERELLVEPSRDEASGGPNLIPTGIGARRGEDQRFAALAALERDAELEAEKLRQELAAIRERVEQQTADFERQLTAARATEETLKLERNELQRRIGVADAEIARSQEIGNRLQVELRTASDSTGLARRQLAAAQEASREALARAQRYERENEALRSQLAERSADASRDTKSIEQSRLSGEADIQPLKLSGDATPTGESAALHQPTPAHGESQPDAPEAVGVSASEGQAGESPRKGRLLVGHLEFSVWLRRHALEQFGFTDKSDRELRRFLQDKGYEIRWSVWRGEYVVTWPKNSL
jgi:hypothetical protein